VSRFLNCEEPQDIAQALRLVVNSALSAGTAANGAETPGMAGDPMGELRAAAERREAVERESERARAQATADLVSAIRRAQDAGTPMAQIAHELGISRQRVYKLLER
jgi:uncharacterized protein involved in type VI secretion and phage assembly